MKNRRIEGPAVYMPLPFQVVAKLPSYTAGDLEYLKIVYNNGKVEHRPGPCIAWLDADVMKNIYVNSGIQIEAHEAVVVYTLDAGQEVPDDPEKLTPEKLKEMEQQGNVTKRIVVGPTVLVPKPTEWLHTFVWHGTDPESRKTGAISGKKIPMALKFQKMRLVPDQMYFDAEGIRTSDDALLMMRFMMYYEVVDLNLMLEQTHDPIAELINALGSDAIAFTSSRTFEQFKNDTELLGKLSTYTQTLERAKRFGFSISKIVYRGYHSSDTLQSMHDEAIEARTKLKLDSETEHQALELEDLRLKRRQERELVVQQIEIENMKHEVWKSQQQVEQRLKEESSSHDLKMRQKKEVNEEDIAFLTRLSSIGVNLTQYLTAQYQRPDNILRIENTTQDPTSSTPLTSGSLPQLHLNINNKK